MKTITLFFFIVFGMTLTANAQITKGNWLAGGVANFVNYKSIYDNGNNESTQTGYGIQIYPDFGYFLRDKFVVGTKVNFNFSNPSGSNNNSTSYGFGPFVRYYFLKPEKKLNIFLDGSYGFSNGKSDFGGKNNSIGYNLQIGSAYFLNESVALELGLQYDNAKNSNNTKNRNFTFGVGFQIHLEKE